MSKSKIDLDKVFKALADPTRREIFHLIVVTGLAVTITDVSAKFNITRQGTTKHLKVLENAGMIHIRNERRVRLCEANLKALKSLRDWLDFYDAFWSDKLKGLDEFLSKNQ